MKQSRQLTSTDAAPLLGEVPTNTLISTDMSEFGDHAPASDGVDIVAECLGPPAQPNNSSDCEYFGVSDDEPAFLQSLWGNEDEDCNTDDNTNKNTEIETNKGNTLTDTSKKANGSTSNFKAGYNAFMNIFSPGKAPYGYASIEDSLLRSVQPETMDGDNKVVCEKCSRMAKLESAKANKKKARKRESRIHTAIPLKGGPASPNSLRESIENEFDHSIMPSNDVSTSDEEKMPLLPSLPEPMPMPTSMNNKGITSPVTVSVSSASSSEDEPDDYERKYSKEEEDALIEKYATDPKLEVKREVQMQLLVDTAPETLVFHLKRFSHGGMYHRGSNKIRGHVKFPFELNLSKYMDNDNSDSSDEKSSDSSESKGKEGTSS